VRLSTLLGLLAFFDKARDAQAYEDRPGQTGSKEVVQGSDGQAGGGAVRRFEIGHGPRSYWLFEPDRGKVERAPVVVFLHGWFAVNPAFYGAWIDHLVRDGTVVIFPRFQNDVGTLPQDFLPNVLSAIRDALEVLHVGVGHVRPDVTRFAVIGHSVGGNLAAQVAAVASDPNAELPIPRAVIALMPGEVIPTRAPSLDRITGTTLLLVVVGEDDLVVGDLRARQIFTETSAIPRSRKKFILFRTDRHGFPPLVAEHTAPTGVNRLLDNGEGILRSLQLSLGEVNALDRAGFWKMSDLTLGAAFRGLTLDDVTRDEARFSHLGYWSDGRKVTPPIVGDDLDLIPRVLLTNGLRLFPSMMVPKPTAGRAQAKTGEGVPRTGMNEDRSPNRSSRN
jgi:dienelactone hydrolase